MLQATPQHSPSPRLAGRAARLLLAGLLVVVAGGLAGCLGPKPGIVDVQKQSPTSPGDPYRVQVLVANTGPGDGQVEVSLRLVDKRTQETIRYDSQDVQLDKDERQHVDFEEMLPPGAPPADQIDVQVSAQYPIE
jgi:hypothetical protein